MKKCALFLAEGFEETEAVALVDVLRRGQVMVEIVSITGNLVVCGSHQIRVNADTLFEDASFDDVDMLILPGGIPGSNNLNAFEPLKELLRKFNSQQKPIAAICAAPFILGEMGLLEGKEAICYPGYESKLTGATISDKRVVISGNMLTSLGLISAVDFGLAIVKYLHGDEVSTKVSAGLLLL
jgi:4-methyl-5(b-hydroxyethyl)-thiazole monophosphate biosynthesis